MELGLEGRVAVVAASSKGLGRAVADALADEGVCLVISGRGAQALDDAEGALKSRGAQVVAVRADVTDASTPEHLVSVAIERFGRLDIVVPNAGGPPAKGALDCDDEAILQAVQANLLTSVRFVRASLPYMRAAGWGRICCIASSTITQANPSLALSNTARTGLWAWAKTAAADLRDTGITLNLACPGYHATDRMIELGFKTSGRPMGDPADFGKVVAFLCSQQAANVNGARIVVDGGDSLAL
ncbi:MAG: SDR family oxidoreductase [Acidimicrobiales bacterium]|jgi:3-oxoacyl-[acyl-carrier protein] reductase